MPGSHAPGVPHWHRRVKRRVFGQNIYENWQHSHGGAAPAPEPPPAAPAPEPPPAAPAPEPPPAAPAPEPPPPEPEIPVTPTETGAPPVIPDPDAAEAPDDESSTPVADPLALNVGVTLGTGEQAVTVTLTPEENGRLQSLRAEVAQAKAEVDHAVETQQLGTYQAWQLRQERYEPAVERLQNYERALRRRGRRITSQRLDRRDAANRAAMTPEDRAEREASRAAAQQDLAHFRETGETREQRAERQRHASDTRAALNETQPAGTRTPDEPETPLSEQPREPLSPGSGFFEQDTDSSGALGSVEADIASGEAEAARIAELAAREEERRRVEAANAARLAQARADQDAYGIDSSETVGSDEPQYEAEIKAFLAGRDEREATLAGLGEEVASSDDPWVEASKVWERDEAAAGITADNEITRQSELQSDDDISSGLGRAFTEEDRAAAQGLDVDINYFDDAEQNRQQFDDDISSTARQGFAPDAPRVDADINYFDDSRFTSEALRAGIAARDEDRRADVREIEANAQWRAPANKRIDARNASRAAAQEASREVEAQWAGVVERGNQAFEEREAREAAAKELLGDLREQGLAPTQVNPLRDTARELFTLGQIKTASYDSHRILSDIMEETPYQPSDATLPAYAQAAARVQAAHDEPSTAELGKQAAVAVALGLPGVESYRQLRQGNIAGAVAWGAFDAATTITPAGLARVARAGGSVADVGRAVGRSATGIGGSIPLPDNLLRSLGDDVVATGYQVADPGTIPLSSLEDQYHTTRIPVGVVTDRGLTPEAARLCGTSWQRQIRETGEDARFDLPSGDTVVMHAPRHGLTGGSFHSAPGTALAQPEVIVQPELFTAAGPHGRFIKATAGGELDAFNPSTIHLLRNPAHRGIRTDLIDARTRVS